MKTKLALAIGPLLVALGAYLLYRGYQVSQSLAGQLSETLTGEPTEQATQYYVAGAVCVVLGLAGGGFGFLKR
ncbi:MAG: DUF3185 family protein [Planctomycetes bacterium]|nr:DUF3185 family protein [Planctomycetota bacterium]